MKLQDSNKKLKTFVSQKDFRRVQNGFKGMCQWVNTNAYLPKLDYGDLLFLLLGVYQLRIARHYLIDSYEKLTMHVHTKSNQNYEIVKFVNAKSRYKKLTRTIVIIFDVNKMTNMRKNIKDEINLWLGMYYWCNCNRGTCTVTPCSHVMTIMYAIYCVQNGIEINENKLNDRLLSAIDFGIIYKKWALKNEKMCIPTCKTYGYNSKTMIKCSGCQNAYHYDCLELETGITKQDIHKQNGKLICNIGQPCLYLRNQKFIETWLKKYSN